MGERKIIGRTEKCIVCLEKAIYYGGHVRLGEMDVLAGWCNKHKDTKPIYLANEQGGFGGWVKEYGFKDEIV